MPTKLDRPLAANRIDQTRQPHPALSDGPISGDRYWSCDFMALEWDAIWTRAWLIGGLEQQIPQPGDYFTYDIGRESILVTRGEDGAVRAFYNVCPHRGNRLVNAEQGHSKNIACAYHGWRFAPDGQLKFVPCPEDFAGGSPCGRTSLKPVRCETFAGFVWVNMDPEAPTLAQHLGPVMAQIDCYQMEKMRRTHWVTCPSSAPMAQI